MNTAAAAIGPETTVGELMTTDVVTLKLDDTLRLVHELMSCRRIRHFPVLDGEHLAGVVEHADLLCESVALSLARHPAESLADALDKVRVKDVIKAAPTVSSDTPIYQAARLMVERAFECLIVVEGNKLLGVVSRMDLLRELAKLQERQPMRGKRGDLCWSALA